MYTKNVDRGVPFLRIHKAYVHTTKNKKDERTYLLLLHVCLRTCTVGLLVLCCYNINRCTRLGKVQRLRHATMHTLSVLVIIVR